jgi:hypothetical protein
LGKGRGEGKGQASPFVGDEPRKLNLVRKETLLRLQKVSNTGSHQQARPIALPHGNASSQRASNKTDRHQAQVSNTDLR